MLHYILQTVAFQLFFLIVYDLFLKKETFFNWNRAYLLITAVLSVALPFVKLESVKHIVPEQFIIRLPEVIIGNVEPVFSPQIVASTPLMTEPTFVWSWSYLWFFGMAIMGLFLGFKVLKLLRLYSKNQKRWKGNLLIIQLINSNAAFSFFYYIFLGDNIKSEEKTAILEHEMVHVNQKHTLDLLLFEVFKIVFWFNPLVYMYQNRMTALHEFIADAKAVNNNNKQQYYQNLLSQVFDTQHISFVNPFFKQSLIKKRILMLSKSKSKQIHLVKYALLIPVVFTMLMYTSSYAQTLKTTDTISKDEAVNQKLTDEELKKKFYDEILAMVKNGADFLEVANYSMTDKDKYISTRNEYIRFMAYIDYIFEKSVDRKSRDGTLEQKDIEMAEGLKSKMKTYQDYLNFKKTDEAKEQWENGSHDGVLRLIVEDMKNMTETEKKRQKDKIDLILKDNFFHTLLVTDGKTSMRTVFQPDDLKTKEEKTYDIEVPFAVIDQVPTFTECESLATNDEKKKCTSNQISEFVNKNFNTNIANKIGLTGKQRISVIFKIDKNGRVKDVRSRAPHPALEAEAIRVIKLLPKMIPGEQKGKPVVVPYSLPILFMVKTDEKANENTTDNGLTEAQKVKLNEDYHSAFENLEAIPFSNVEEAPMVSQCEMYSSNKARKRCVNNFISDYINDNFDPKIADKLNIKGRITIAATFKIDKLGMVKNVQAKSNNPALEAEVIRAIKTLPVFIPGKQKGKPVVVSYSLPIMFQIHE